MFSHQISKLGLEVLGSTARRTARTLTQHGHARSLRTLPISHYFTNQTTHGYTLPIQYRPPAGTISVRTYTSAHAKNSTTPTFQRPNILAGGGGDVASRLIRLAAEHPEVNVFIIQIKGSKPPFELLPKNVHIIWTDTQEGSPYVNVPFLEKVIQQYKINEYFPGWGNLSENASALQTIENAMKKYNGRVISPNFDFIDNVGDKGEARSLAIRAGVPVVPGPEGLVSESNYDAQMAYFKDGETVMFKAPKTGGGYGMRKTTKGVDDAEMFGQASLEGNCTGTGLVAEKFVDDDFLHIEKQSFGIRRQPGQAPQTTSIRISRNCSVQFKNAKWFQFSDPNDLPESVSNLLDQYSENLGNLSGQLGPATHEFIVVVKEDTPENMAYLMKKYRVEENKIIREGGRLYLVLYNETNPRLQVEHPVTELACGDLDILWSSRLLAYHHQTHNQAIADEVASQLDRLNQQPLSAFIPAIQLRVYNTEDETWDGKGLKVKLGTTTQSAPAIIDPQTNKVFIDGTGGPSPTGQDPLFCRINASGKNIDHIVGQALDALFTGGQPTNKGLLTAILSEGYRGWTVQKLSSMLTDPDFVNSSRKPTWADNLYSALRALAETHHKGLKFLRPGAQHPPAAVIPKTPEITFTTPELTNHYGHIMPAILEDNPTLTIVEARKLAAVEYCRRIRERYNPQEKTVGYIDTRKRDTGQSSRQNIQPREVDDITEAYFNRQSYISVEMTMGGNDQAARAEYKSENERFNRTWPTAQVPAGLCRGSMQVKLGDKKASIDERLAYIRDKVRDNNGPMLVEEFSPFHNVEDWVEEAKLWTMEGNIVVLYPPEHAHEMSSKELMDEFILPCLRRAKEEGFYDQIAFVALKDTGSATTPERVINELSLLPTLAREAGFGELPWGHHTHDLSQGVLISYLLAQHNFRIFWTSPDCYAGTGANVPECGLYNVLSNGGFEVDFNPKAAQEMAPVDHYTKIIGAPYAPNHHLTSTTIIDNYLASGAIPHTVKDLRATFPDASDKELNFIFSEFSDGNRRMFMDVLRVPPLTPNPNKISKIVMALLKLSATSDTALSAMTHQEFADFCLAHLEKLPELAKYLSGHYPEWPQYKKVEAEYPDMVKKAQQVYSELDLGAEDASWETKLSQTQDTFLSTGVHYTDSSLVDSAYHGTNMIQHLGKHGLTPESMEWLGEGDLQRMSLPGPCQDRSGVLHAGSEKIPFRFLGSVNTNGTTEYLAQVFSDSGQILKIPVSAPESETASGQATSYGLQPTGYYINKSKEGEVQKWYVGIGIVFPGENVCLLNESKTTAPITAPSLSSFLPLIGASEGGKKFIAKEGQKILSFSATGLAPDVETALLELHDLRGCEPSSSRAFLSLPEDSIREAIKHYPIREVKSAYKDDFLQFLEEEIGTHPLYQDVKNMFEKQLCRK